MITAQLKMARWFAEGAGELRVQIELATGSLTALVGPSGSGKTTLLRLLAGLETPTQGYIQVDDTIWLDSAQRINLRPQQRSVGYIFQDAALFPNLTVRENILFVTPKGETGRADELIRATGLGPFVHQKPPVLSGGQQQRVALARALVRRPRLLLLDEPFAALDAESAHQLREVLLALHRAWETTTLIVSHQSEDVQALADRVIRLSQGQIVADYPNLLQATQDSLGERIERIWFDQTQQQWVIQTATFQLRSANPAWGQLSVGALLNLSW
ncbi:sulfate/molybdate ABC transporter ATP-binding protein [Spirosoma humi]